MKTSGSTNAADRMRRLLLVLIPLAVLAAFWPTLRAGFITWDDDANFLNNPHFRGLDWQNLRWMFTTLYMSNYQPLSWLVSCLGHSLWGMDPFGYHASSLAFHMLNAILFYLVAARLLRLAAHLPDDDMALSIASGAYASLAGRRRSIAGGFGEAARSAGGKGGEAGAECEANPSGVPVMIASAFAALFFALHPLRVESVAWLSGQHDLQAAAFYLLAILCYLRACSDEARRRRWLLGCAALFAASMLSKANGITLPVTLLLLDFYPLRRLPLDPRQWPKPQHRRVWLEKVPLLALAVAAGLVSFVARHQTAVLQPLSLGFRIQQAFYGLGFYLGKTVAPVQLMPFYPIPLDRRLPPLTVAACVGLVLALTAMLLYRWRRWPGGLVAWVHYVVTLLPVLGLISISILLVADRYTYIPGMALALLGGAAALGGLRRLATQHRYLMTAELAAVLFLLAGQSWRQSKLWHDSETLFRHVLTLNPNIPEVHNNLGFVLVNQLRIDEGMVEYRKALDIKPDFVKAMNNLGLALLSQGNIAEGIEQCRRALELDPDYAFAHNNLGLALMYMGQTAEALPHFQKAVALVPEYVMAYINLGTALLTLGRIDEAIAQFQKALELRPDYSAAADMLRAAEAQRSH
jgi:tetratricopeptide (TPR) repeat protein